MINSKLIPTARSSDGGKRQDEKEKNIFAQYFGLQDKPSTGAKRK